MKRWIYLGLLFALPLYGDYHIEEHSDHEESCSCDVDEDPYDPDEPHSYRLPQSFHSRPHRHRCTCWGDLDDDWYEEDPSWPSKREQSWIDELGH